MNIPAYMRAARKALAPARIDLSALQTHAYPLDDVNDALVEVKRRPGGLVNIVVNPDR